MKFILGEKIEMTQVFNEEGKVLPVTKIKAGPCTVVQIKKNVTDGYTAAQLGFGEKKKLSGAVKGHLKQLGNFRYLKEFRLAKDEDLKDLTVGAKIDASIFAPEAKVQISGISRGKGFQGVVKRHHFHGSPKTHGHKDQVRMPGSIGATGPQRVFKGKRMGGHMGAERVSVKNLKVVSIDRENNLLYLKGAVPGARHTLLEIRSID